MSRPKAAPGAKLCMTLPVIVDLKTATRLREMARREDRSVASLLRKLVFAGEAALAYQRSPEMPENPEKMEGDKAGVETTQALA